MISKPDEKAVIETGSRAAEGGRSGWNWGRREITSSRKSPKTGFMRSAASRSPLGTGGEKLKTRGKNGLPESSAATWAAEPSWRDRRSDLFEFAEGRPGPRKTE